MVLDATSSRSPGDLRVALFAYRWLAVAVQYHVFDAFEGVVQFVFEKMTKLHRIVHHNSSQDSVTILSVGVLRRHS